MAIPSFQHFFLPFLNCISDGKEYGLQDLMDHLAKTFNLSQDDANEVLPSGRVTRLRNRVAWTRTYLSKALLVESSGRGRFRITQRGRELLATNPAELDVRSLKKYPEFQAFQQAGTDDNASNSTEEQVVAGETPEERLESSYLALRKELVQALLQQVLNTSPAFFEQLVVDLLVAMGYGGSRVDAGKAVGQSGDEGIDGIIKEDRLGLDIIYLQAKRWQNPVGRPQVQAFVGSLVGKGAGKGVMLTTSRFTDDARQFVKHLQQKVVLIDGEELAALMIDFNVGVSATTQYVVKKIDLDYFGEE
ncbi:restriction endonuclease [Burkholderia sp. JPY481]